MQITNMIIPIMVLLIIVYGALKKVNIYDEFINGALESFDMILKIFPCLLAMIFGVNIFLKSGLLDLIYIIVKPIFLAIKVPIDVFPMILMRPISGTSTLAILNSIFESFGPDSYSSFRNVYIIINDNQILYWLFVIIKYIPDGFARQVHISLRFDKHDLVISNHAFSYKSLELQFIDPYPVFIRNQVHCQKTHVMTSVLVFFARISESNNNVHFLKTYGLHT